MKQFYVYLHCKPDGIPFYVGKGYLHRAYQFKHNRSKWYKNIVAKYGKENIIVETQLCIDEQEALELEVLFILSLCDDGVELCNLTEGGDGVSGYKHTAEANERNRQAHLGKPSKMKGKKASAEAVEKNRLGHLGKKQTPEANAKRSAAMKGKTWKHKKPMSAEQRTLRSSRLKGKPWSEARRKAEKLRKH